MGSRVFWLVLSLLLVLIPSQAQTGRTGTKDAKEDVRRRRQHARRQSPISLKPAPQDWPEPELNAGDFLVIPNTEATSLSPLLAYQAKLEQEYLRQNQDAARGKKTETPKDYGEHVKWTSSEEELKKLLNPEELLKHNKPLKTFVTDKHTKYQGKSAAIKSLSSMKAAKTVPKKKKKEVKAATSKITSTTAKRSSRRGRKGQSEVKNEYAEDLKPLKELKKQRVMSKVEGSEEPKTRKRRKKSRKFAFSNRSVQDGKSERVKKSSRSRMDKSITPERSKEVSYTTNNLRETISTLNTNSVFEITTAGLTPNISFQTTEPTTHKPITGVATTKRVRLEATTTERISTEPILTTKDVPTVNTSTESPRTFVTLRDNRRDIRNKRKEMKEEMEKLLKAEQLQGSFSDNSSAWTTSEFQIRKISMYRVTPRQALLGLFKHNMDTFVRHVFKDSAKYTEEKDG